MRKEILLLVAFTISTLSAFAQSPGIGPNRDPIGYKEAARFSDELLARKAFEASQKRLSSARLKQAIQSYEKGMLPELRISWGEFVTASGTEFLATQFSPALPIPIDSRVTLFGAVVGEDGKVLTDFEEPARFTQSKKDIYIDRSVFISAQKARVTVGVARDTEVLAIGQVAIDPEALAKNTVGVSRVILSDNIFVLPAAQSPFDPFAFGGMKVVPKPDRTFAESDEVWLFTELRNPAIGADGKPHVTVRLSLDGPSKIRMPAGAIDAQPVRGVAGHFALGTTISVSHLPPGLYHLRLTVTDTEAGKSFDRDETLTIVE